MATNRIIPALYANGAAITQYVIGIISTLVLCSQVIMGFLIARTPATVFALDAAVSQAVSGQATATITTTVTRSSQVEIGCKRVMVTSVRSRRLLRRITVPSFTADIAGDDEPPPPRASGAIPADYRCCGGFQGFQGFS